MAAVDRVEAAQRFLEAVYGAAPPGALVISTAQPGQDNSFRGAKWHTGQLNGLAEWMVGVADAGTNVYQSCGLIDPDAGAPPKRGTAAQVIALTAAWADLDIDGDGHKKGGLCPSLDAAAEKIRTFPIAPTMVVGSGGGLHLWWLFDAPYLTPDQPRRDRGRNLVRDLQAALRHHVAPWPLDSTDDPSRVLRCPGTLNVKDPANPRPVRVLQSSERRYSFTDLEQTVAGLPKTSGAKDGGGTTNAGGTVRQPRGGPIADTIPAGERTDTLVSLAGTMNRRGMSVDAITQALQTENMARCQPALPKEKVAAIAADVAMRYAHQREQAAARPSVIFSSTEQLRDRVDRVVDVLRTTNNPPRLFNRAAGTFVRIGRDLDGRADVELVGQTQLVDHLAQVADWHKFGANGKQIAADPPVKAASTILSRSEPVLPVLDVITRAPTFLPDGDLTTRRGYYPTARLYYSPDDELRPLAIPALIKVEDMHEAVDFLGDLICDFPFDSEASRANAVAMSLTPYVRHLVPGPVPAWLIDAPRAGTGKGLLLNTLLGDLFGGDVPVTVATKDGDEWRKRLTAMFLDSHPVIAIDNISEFLDSPALAAALTTGWWSDRLLGKTQTLTLPVKAMFVLTGNGVGMTGELARRTVYTRLDADVTDPSTRSGFHHQLPADAYRRRVDIIRAKLLIVGAWVQFHRAGMAPDIEGPTFGSYQAWANTMAAILQFADIAGFLENIDEFRRDQDPDHAAWEQLSLACQVRFGGEWATAHQIARLIEDDGEIHIDLGGGTDNGRAMSLGRMLTARRGARFGDAKLKTRMQNGRRQYRFER